MDFSLFGHMERINADQPQDELYEDFIGLCKMADEGGMRAIWTGEHHGMEFTIAPNPFLTIVDIAHHTKNVKLGTGTVIVPFWHPVRLAGEAAMADLVTGGRVEIGAARGAYSYEYDRMVPGMDAWDAGQRMRESLPLLRPLWEGDCAHEGTYHSFPATTSTPSPKQAGGPPIWVAARDINSHEFAIENGFDVQVTPLWQGNAEIDDLMAKYKEACAKFGVKDRKIMLLHHTYVASDAEDADRGAEELSRFYNYFGAWFQNKRPVANGFIEEIPAQDMAANKMMAPETLRRDLTIGTAKEVIDRIKRYEDLGYDEFSFWVDSGMSTQRKRASLGRFIDEVMPAFS